MFPRQIILTVCVSLWGLRIAGFLLYRILKTNEDHRFDEIRGNFFAFLGFFLFQMVWVYTGTLGTIIVNSTITDIPLNGCDWAGLAMFIVGLLVETEADRSKDAFRDDPSNRNKWCTDSVWQWSRHPNYFGEILLWWGVWLVSYSAFTEQWMLASLVGPLFTMTILFFLSGMNLSEPKYAEKFQKNAEYKNYLETTSILIPLPNFLYGALPSIVKVLFLFELPFYTQVKNVGKADLDV